MITNRFSPSELKKLRNGFDKFDKNKNGKIDREEFAELLRQNGMNLSEEVCDFTFKAADKNNSGGIDFEEYLAMAHMGTFPHDEAFKGKMIFDFFDKNMDGVIQFEELENALGKMGIEDLDAEDIADILKDFDKNDDGVLDFAEFFTLYQMMKEEAESDDDGEENED